MAAAAAAAAIKDRNLMNWANFRASEQRDCSSLSGKRSIFSIFCHMFRSKAHLLRQRLSRVGTVRLSPNSHLRPAPEGNFSHI